MHEGWSKRQIRIRLVFLWRIQLGIQSVLKEVRDYAKFCLAALACVISVQHLRKHLSKQTRHSNLAVKCCSVRVAKAPNFGA